VAAAQLGPDEVASNPGGTLLRGLADLVLTVQAYSKSLLNTTPSYAQGHLQIETETTKVAFCFIRKKITKG
jgi:hypothetical protein